MSYYTLSYNDGMQPGWQDQIRIELANAGKARQAGNEGRARVCARRAAGLAARDFLARHAAPVQGSTLDALKELAEFPGLPPDLRAAAAHLTMRVGEDFALPPDIDLILEAHNLIGGLA
jgi:hypothetical protein